MIAILYSNYLSISPVMRDSHTGKHFVGKASKGQSQKVQQAVLQVIKLALYLKILFFPAICHLS